MIITFLLFFFTLLYFIFFAFSLHFVLFIPAARSLTKSEQRSRCLSSPDSLAFVEQCTTQCANTGEASLRDALRWTLPLICTVMTSLPVPEMQPSGFDVGDSVGSIAYTLFPFLYVDDTV